MEKHHPCILKAVLTASIVYTFHTLTRSYLFSALKIHIDITFPFRLHFFRQEMLLNLAQ